MIIIIIIIIIQAGNHISHISHVWAEPPRMLIAKLPPGISMDTTLVNFRSRVIAKRSNGSILK